MLVSVKFTINTDDYGKAEFKKEIEVLVKDIDPKSKVIDFDMAEIKKSRIVRVEEPSEKRGLYRVWFLQHGVEYPADLSEQSYKVLVLEEELLQSGVDSSKLEDFKRAVVEERDEEHKYDEEY
jgi:hypothetical protein